MERNRTGSYVTYAGLSHVWDQSATVKVCDVKRDMPLIITHRFGRLLMSMSKDYRDSDPSATRSDRCR